ncbi:F-box domain protein [Xylaria digitata]|nr:F-box domain protein [Xylaria digitata]
MATSTFVNLSAELLDEIIRYSLPEGFESLALTCKRFHALCAPYIREHNQLCLEFRYFTYRPYGYQGNNVTIPSINLAFELITRIAMEPRVIRYIKDADLSYEDWPHRVRVPIDVPDVDDDGPVVALFAYSPYLARAGLDWKEFYAQIVHEAKQPDALSKGRSLARVVDFELYCQAGVGSPPCDLNESVPFLALPHPYLRYGETLETVTFESCFIDEVAIAEFLEHTPRLRTLEYYHTSKGDAGNLDWNICKFVTAIERKIGSHLEQLSIFIPELRGSTFPGKASMRGFQRLQKLEIPLEMVMCNINTTESQDGVVNNSLQDQGESEQEPFICDIVPASVSILALQSDGHNHHGIAPKVMFRGLSSFKASKLPSLEEIHLSSYWDQKLDNEFRRECERLPVEAEKAGHCYI